MSVPGAPQDDSFFILAFGVRSCSGGPLTRMSLPACALLLIAQTAGAPESVLGEVTAVQNESITLRTDAGSSVVLGTDDRTTVLRSRPGTTNLSGAVPIPRSEIAVGDRVLARGTYSSDRAALSAARLVVMKRADIEGKREREQEEWRRRGLGGVVTALDASTGEMTVRLRGGSNGQETVRVPITGRGIVLRRYAPNSVKFSDARPSAFEELRTGDQVRMLGELSGDGATFVPEQIVSGAFRTLRGRVVNVDVGRGELSVQVASDDGPPMTVTVTAGKDARLHRLPAALPLSAPAVSGPESPRATPPAVDASGAEGTRQHASLDEMLERLPRISLAQLATGEHVAVLGSLSDDVTRLNAIKLVAGLPAPGAQDAEDHGERGRPGGEEAGDGPDRLGFGGELPW